MGFEESESGIGGSEEGGDVSPYQCQVLASASSASTTACTLEGRECTAGRLSWPVAHVLCTKRVGENIWRLHSCTRQCTDDKNVLTLGWVNTSLQETGTQQHVSAGDVKHGSDEHETCEKKMSGRAPSV